jgi:hypothetical protein
MGIRFRDRIWPEIRSVREYIDLCHSDDRDEMIAGACGWAESAVWKQVILEHPRMGIWMVSNPTVPISILEILSLNDWAEVRGEIASGDKLSRRIFDRLVNDPHPLIRESIARNAKTPNTVLEAMLRDPHPTVRNAAEDTLAKRKEWREMGIRRKTDPTGVVG